MIPAQTMPQRWKYPKRFLSHTYVCATLEISAARTTEISAFAVRKQEARSRFFISAGVILFFLKNSRIKPCPSFQFGIARKYATPFLTYIPCSGEAPCG